MTRNKFSINTIHLILIYFLVFGILYLFITPPFESPDEFLHLDYINYISKHKSLPNQYEGFKDPLIFVGQGHQHPLYYVIMAIPVHLFTTDGKINYEHPSTIDKNWKGGTPDKNTYAVVFPNREKEILFYIIRLFSLFFSLIYIYFIYRISSLFFTESSSRLFAVFIAASIPQFQFISSVINNDSMSNMFATAGIFYLLKIIDSPKELKQYIIAAIFISLGILTKKTVMFILPCAVILILYIILKNKDVNLKSNIFKNSILFIFIILVLTSFIFIRNYIEYGEFLAGNMEKTTMLQFVEIKSIFSYYFIQPFTQGMLNSFIGVFGWMNIPVPKFIGVSYSLFFITGFSASLYLLFKLINYRFLFLFLLFTVCLGGIVYFNLTFTQYQGRYMFPVLSAISIISVYGNNFLLDKFKNVSIKKYILILIVFIICIYDIISILTLYLYYNN